MAASDTWFVYQHFECLVDEFVAFGSSNGILHFAQFGDAFVHEVGGHLVGQAERVGAFFGAVFKKAAPVERCLADE